MAMKAFTYHFEGLYQGLFAGSGRRETIGYLKRGIIVMENYWCSSTIHFMSGFLYGRVLRSLLG